MLPHQKKRVRSSDKAKFPVLWGHLCYIVLNIFSPFLTYIVKSKDIESGSGSAGKAKAGTAIFLIELEKKRSIKAGFCVFLKTVLAYLFSLYSCTIEVPFHIGSISSKTSVKSTENFRE